MSKIHRRQFLQFSASALAALGWNQLDLQRQGLRYARTLAQSTPRKLALLVGINGYRDRALHGCLTDVQLQRELLIHGFGFNPNDILLVTDDAEIKPTRAGILQAFENHLIDQAQPGDIVVFHFSGHGAQVFDPNSPDENQLNSTFVPLDRVETPAGDRAIVSDITGETLFLLMSALRTENVAVVLDSCHSGGGKRGNLTIRAIPGGKNTDPSPEERDYQAKWRETLGLSAEGVQQQRRAGIAKGVVVASAAPDQLAADAPFDGFFAGAFTYALTQYLWQVTGREAVSSVMGNVARATTRISSSRQIPEFEAKPGKAAEPAYFLPQSLPPAEAVIRRVEGDAVDLWLGGIDPQILVAFEKDAIFILLNRDGSFLGLVRLDSRQGLVGKGTLLDISQPNAVKPGLPLQEQIRAIPEDAALRIGLDESLGQDGSRTLMAVRPIPQLEPVPLGETEVHYILGRMTEERYRELTQHGETEIPAIGSLGLYAPGLDVIPGSFGDAGESVTAGLTRLRAKFRALFAARLVKLTLNADSSRLKVVARMKLNETQDAIAQEFPIRSLQPTETPPNIPPTQRIEFANGIPLLPVGTRVRFEIENQENRDLYVTVLVITSEGEMLVLFPNSWTASAEAAIVEAGKTRYLPDPSQGDRFKITVGKPLGTADVLVIASATPLRDALKTLQSIAAVRGVRDGSALPLGEEAEETVNSLLGDLNTGTRNLYTEFDSKTRNLYAEFDPEARVVNTAQLAAMSITFRTVEG